VHYETLAGYRVLRTIGSGHRAHVYLGRGMTAAAETAEAPDVGVSESPSRLVALKLFHRPDDPGVVGEVESLSLALSEHVVKLHDIATLLDHRRCLVLEWLPRGSLGQLLERRREIDAGEAVTILAPLATALDSLHHSGVVHGGLRPSAVLLSASGSPSLAGFGHAQLVPLGMSAAALAVDVRVREDQRAFSALCRLVLEQVASARTAPALAWLTNAEATGFTDNFGGELSRQLFEMATPIPVQLYSGRELATPDRDFRNVGLEPQRPSSQFSSADFSGAETRTIDLPGAERPGAERLGAERLGAERLGTEQPGTERSQLEFRSPWLHSLNLPDWVEVAIVRGVASVVGGRVGTSLHRLLRLRGRVVRAEGQGVRRRTFVFAAVAVASVVGIVVLVIGGSPTSSPVEREVTVIDTFSSGSVADGALAAVTGNDPVVAVRALLEARLRCLAEVSVLCLDSVSQQSSTAMAEDVARIRALSDGTPTSFDVVTAMTEGAAEFVLIERLGDSALVGAPQHGGGGSETASILVMRGEAGWLLRSFIVRG